ATWARSTTSPCAAPSPAWRWDCASPASPTSPGESPRRCSTSPPRSDPMKLLRKPTATGLVLFLLCLMYLITYIDRVNIATAAEPIRKEFHLSATSLGLAFSAFGYAYLLLQVSGGWIADRFGPRKTLTISGLIWAGSTMLTGAVSGLWSLFSAR